MSATQFSTAQLYWDGTDTTVDADGGDGVWDVNSTANWDTAATGGSPAVWPVLGADMVLGGASGTLTIADGASTVIRNMTIEPGVGTINFHSATDGTGPVLLSNATWNINDNVLNFRNNGGDDGFPNDTTLTIPSAQTLTITGTGTFNTGERPVDAAWEASSATLDFQAGTLRGHSESVGSFFNVRMADGSQFIHERNAGQTYINNWELDGDVTFGNRFSGGAAPRDLNLNGEISGNGRLIVADLGRNDGSDRGTVTLSNAANSFTGGVVIDSTLTRTEINVPLAAGDGAFGAVPTTVDPDHIMLINGGELRLSGITLDSNRGITLDGGGIIVNSGSANTYGGAITGTGGFQIGRDQGLDQNRLILTGNASDYTGGTRIWNGTLELGIDNAIPKDLLTVGGVLNTGGIANFESQGFDLELTGLQSIGNQTRNLFNSSATDSTLTFDVAEGDEFTYGANIDDRVNSTTNGTSDDGTIHFVKNGAGQQTFSRAGNTSWHGNLTVNDGRFRVVNPAFFDSDNDGAINLAGVLDPRVTVNGGTLVLDSGGGGQWQPADLDEALNTVIFAPGSRLGINTVNTDLTYATNISGVQGLEKSGGNSLTLTGTNTYSGETVVREGLLLINGDNSGATGSVMVLGGTLGGTGTIGGDVSVSAGGTLAPGVTAGTLSLNGNSLTMLPDDLTGMDPLVAALQFDLEGADTTIGGGINDLIDGVGDLTLDGTLNVTEATADSFLSAQLNDSWRLINYSGSLTDNALVLGDLPALTDGLAFRIDVTTAGQVNLTIVDGASGFACDFDGSGVCDTLDINSLIAEIASGNDNMAFDLNGDGVVNLDDRDQWLTEAGEMNIGAAFLIGDANLDGSVDVSDFNAWNSNRFTTVARWDFGEFNGDGSIDTSDFNLWNTNKFTSSADSINTVPEPSLGVWFFVVGGMLSLSRRTKRRS